MRSGNPALGNSTFLDLGTGTVVRGDTGAMTLNGTVNKTAFLLVLTLVGAMYTWSRFFAGDGAGLMPFVWGGLIGGLVLALVTVFKKEWSPVTAPLYAVFVFEGMGFIHDSGWMGIGFSLVVVVVAALNLVLDFDFIEQGVEQGAPKYMEWYGAFGLLVTLVWLYLEILRLLSKLQSRD